MAECRQSGGSGHSMRFFTAARKCPAAGDRGTVPSTVAHTPRYGILPASHYSVVGLNRSGASRYLPLSEMVSPACVARHSHTLRRVLVGHLALPPLPILQLNGDTTPSTIAQISTPWRPRSLSSIGGLMDRRPPTSNWANVPPHINFTSAFTVTHSPYMDISAHNILARLSGILVVVQ
ncbi:hypothetical protein D9619_001958 [Psilocybe cf. subviscida]|uniref:Uncharacterized protein n=1 Tax=Psilocybe cf. subviscida TaxID=2480587 RepID=A0A8H5BGA5_9AGAR|nr:hypothetical protein D9619_001958 [Psilocybe cf. subviscida]